MQRMVKYKMVSGTVFSDVRSIAIMSDIMVHGDSKRLHLNGEVIPYFLHSYRSFEYAKLALILEMGGGLLDFNMGNIVERKKRSYTLQNGELVREKYFDESIGNIALVPNDKARQNKGYEEYMKRLESVDPECAAIVNKTGRKFLLADVNERSKRKTHILDEFFKRSK